MGFLYHDKRTGNWIVNFTDANGRRIRKSSETTDRKTADMMLRRLETDRDKAKALGITSVERLRPVTFSEFVEQTYLPALKPPTRRESTHERDVEHYERVKGKFGDMKLPSITPADVERYVTAMKSELTAKKTPPSNATINRRRQFLSAVFAMAKRHGQVTENPVDAVKKLREDNTRDRVITPEEEAKILKESPEFLRPIITVAMGTGMRLGEIAGLRWDAVERREGEVVLEGFIRIGTESKGHRARYVPINADVKAALDALRPVEGPEGFIPHVFVNARFLRAYRPDSIYGAFIAAAERAGVADVCFHSLRHTFVSRMVAQGRPDREIMQITGHRTTSMVSRYAHLAPKSTRGATACLASKGVNVVSTEPGAQKATAVSR